MKQYGMQRGWQYLIVRPIKFGPLCFNLIAFSGGAQSRVFLVLYTMKINIIINTSMCKSILHLGPSQSMKKIKINSLSSGVGIIFLLKSGGY